MSRSYKKNAILKDRGKSHKYEKKLSSSKIRANVRTILTSSDDYDNMLFPDERAKDIINSYDICDNLWIYSSAPFIWYNTRVGDFIIEVSSQKDYRMYKNK